MHFAIIRVRRNRKEVRKMIGREKPKRPPFIAVKESFGSRLALNLTGAVLAGNIFFGGLLWALSGKGFEPGRIMLFYLLSGVLTMLGIAIISVFHSHKVAGPLYRVRQVARDIAEGKLYQRVKFREGDALHPLAGSINSALERMSVRQELLVDEFNRLETACEKIKNCLKKGEKPGQELFSEIDEARKEINEMLGEVKL
jgi:methyl-accepting chemotaxis protein